MTDFERFWSRVKKTRTCWLWIGTTCQAFFWHGKLQQVRRVAWELQYGPIPDGMKVVVDCGEPKCVRHIRITHVVVPRRRGKVWHTLDYRKRVAS